MNHKIRVTIVGSILLISWAGYASGGMITGTVKDSVGTPLRGTFVRARNTETKITKTVLSDAQGKYEIQDLLPGVYELKANAVGYGSDLRTGVRVTVGNLMSFDFTLPNSIVRWSDLSLSQGRALLPNGKGKNEFFLYCTQCHGFHRMADTRRDESGWQREVNWMRDAMSFFISRGIVNVTDSSANDIASYLNSVFGLDSDLPRSPAEVPNFKEVMLPFSEEATKIVYVEYELPGPKRFPWNPAQDKEGSIWISYYASNKIAKLDPRSGKIEEFGVPTLGLDRLGIRSVDVAPDGTVWFTEQSTNTLGKLDPRTKKFSKYQAVSREGMRLQERGQKHTVRVDSRGYVWVSGTPLSRFDPKTEKFTEIGDVPSATGHAFDRDDNLWYAEFRPNGKIGRVDAKSLKVTKWSPPTIDGRPRRINLDSAGIVWFTEYEGNKIGRFDPKTQVFKEYPTPSAHPYALAIDKDNNIWYSSLEQDIIGKLDPQTGQIIEYPAPYPDNNAHDFGTDSEGQVWWVSPPNDKIGYIAVKR